ncbi:MAG: universal stress protein [Aerococcus sp.]|nr:universal stress protein [Aerococcus sp.]
MTDYTHIMAPVDGSAEAERAFKKAVTLASKKRAKLLIIYINDSDAPSAQLSSSQQMTQLLNNYASYAHKHEVTSVETRVILGEPKQQIAKILPSNYAIDLIVIGATGRNVFDRLMLGSVTEYVVRTAPCDVLVVRTPEQ